MFQRASPSFAPGCKRCQPIDFKNVTHRTSTKSRKNTPKWTTKIHRSRRAVPATLCDSPQIVCNRLRKVSLPLPNGHISLFHRYLQRFGLSAARASAAPMAYGNPGVSLSTGWRMPPNSASAWGSVSDLCIFSPDESVPGAERGWQQWRAETAGLRDSNHRRFP